MGHRNGRGQRDKGEIAGDGGREVGRRKGMGRGEKGTGEEKGERARENEKKRQMHKQRWEVGGKGMGRRHLNKSRKTTP